MSMELDFDACLKSLRNSFHKYKKHSSEDTRKDLEREINVIVGITNNGEGFIANRFNPKNLLHAESLSVFVSILNETKLKESMYAASISLLNGLASSSKIRETLQDAFKLTSTLLSFIMQHQAPNDQALLLQTLQLLQQVTYGIKIHYSLGELDSLINFLTSKIMSPESKLTMYCLGTLANLCRSNVVVQDYIKNMSNVKGFFKSVASFLSHHNWMNIIYALSILTISLDEPLGEKVFNKKNIDQTFVLIFNVLLKGGGAAMQKYSCDLLLDLLKCSRMQQYLANYADLQSHVKELVFQLTTADEELIEKILQLLISMKNIPDLLRMIFFEKCENNKTCGDKNDVNNCMSIILDLSGKLMTTSHQLASLAMKFLKMLYQQINSCKRHCATKLVQVLSQYLHLLKEEGSSHLKERYESIRRSIEILTILCCERMVVNVVTDLVSSERISQLIQIMCDRYSTELSATRDHSFDHREEVSSVVIVLIELLALVVKNTNQGQDIYSTVLQSSGLSPFLASCLASRSPDLVKRSMKIVKSAIYTPNFSTDSLSTFLASNNQRREEEIVSLKKENSFETSYNSTANACMENGIAKTMKKEGTAAKQERSADVVAALAERISSDLEIKDSWIMDIYEHKLSAVQTNENHLQDLLDAKTAALAQADRLIAQYRCRSAQSEAECLKLRSLLLENQKTSEDQKEQIESLQEEKKELSEISLEHDQLKLAHQQHLERLNTAQNDLLAADEEQKKLNETNELLKKHCDEFRNQYELSQQQLRQIDAEKQNTIKRLKDKEKKLDETIKIVAQMDEKIKEQSYELQEGEKKLKLAETEVQILQQAKGELNEKIDELEKEKRNLMNVIKEFQQQKIAHQEQIEKLVQQVNEIDKERQTKVQKLKEFEKEYQESVKTISMLKKELKQKENENREAEKRITGIEKKLKQAEKAKLDLNHKVSSLGILNDKYEKDMMQKDDSIQELKQQLEKHSQIAAMIHNLSSGKIPCNTLNFSS